MSALMLFHSSNAVYPVQNGRDSTKHLETLRVPTTTTQLTYGSLPMSADAISVTAIRQIGCDCARRWRSERLRSRGGLSKTLVCDTPVPPPEASAPPLPQFTPQKVHPNHSMGTCLLLLHVAHPLQSLSIVYTIQVPINDGHLFWADESR